jgi:hypothetical protein
MVKAYIFYKSDSLSNYWHYAVMTSLTAGISNPLEI